VCPKEGLTAGVFKWIVPLAPAPKPPRDTGPFPFACDMRSTTADEAWSHPASWPNGFTPPMCVQVLPLSSKESAHMNPAELKMRDNIDSMLPGALCTLEMGTVVPSCPTHGVAGRCEGVMGPNDRTVKYYYQGADLPLARFLCGKGSWTAP
jgi:hypothetical protein